jgi:phosphoribosylanthranilate isomerase
LIVKICGFTRVEDVVAACELDADMIGVILVEGSRRQVTKKQAQALLSASFAKKVVVCKPRDLTELLEVERELKPDYLQIHPSLSPQEFEEARKLVSAGLILVLPIPPTGASVEDLITRAKRLEPLADYILLDTLGAHGGGTGVPHDWSLSRSLRSILRTPVLLAGGLNPENVRRAIQTVRPAGVDVATGVETRPGKKDRELMRSFIERAKGVSP